MPSPFPGMDPWLETPEEWPGFHDTLVIKTVEILQPQLRARGYYAKPGERVWLSRLRGITPDVTVIRRPAEAAMQQGAVAIAEPDEPVRIAHAEFEIHQSFVDVYVADSHELVTGIEYVSPTNKTDKTGRRLYQQKQRDLESAQVHLVEIDLIRRGPHILDLPEEIVQALKPWEYLVNLVRRGAGEHEVYPLRITEHLPRIRVPLKADDDDAVLDLQDVFDRSYDINPYPERLNYDTDPPPPEWDAATTSWIDELLKNKGLRK